MPAPDNTVEIMMSRGQSLALGANAGGLFAPTSQRWRDVFSGVANRGAYMLEGLRRSDAAAVTHVANPLLSGYASDAQATGFGPMVAQTNMPEGAVLTCAMLRDGLHPAIAFQFHDAGGQSIQNLDSDPNTGTVGVIAPYQNSEKWLSEAARIATATGKTLTVTRMFLDQGEADVSQARGWWLAAANVTKADWDAQITRLTGRPAPRYFVQQTGGYMFNTLTNRHQCKLDQLDFVRQHSGILTGPLYPYKIDNSDDKGVHKTWLDYIKAYEVAAWAAREVAAGRAWNLLPGTATRSGNAITIPVSVRGDETLTTVSGIYTNYGGDPDFYGFEVVGGGTITSVVVGASAITVNVTGTVTSVRYAMQQTNFDYRTLVDANSEGYGTHRGLVRTTLTRTVTWGGQSFTCERWLPSFEVSL